MIIRSQTVLVLVGVAVFSLSFFGLSLKSAFACSNPASVPGGFATPCPVFDVEPAQATATSSVSVVIAPSTAKQFISQTFYIYNGSSWQNYNLNGTFSNGYSSATGTYTISPTILSALPAGPVYLAEWDWTWNANLGCFVGPNSAQCGQGEWRAQEFTLQGGNGTIGSGAPTQYPGIRTDLCEFGTESGCSGLGLSFLGENKTTAAGIYDPLQEAPDIGGLYGMNNCIIDPDFHTKICRMTDYSMVSEGRTFNVGSAGNNNMWAEDGSMFLILNSGGGYHLMSFNTSTMQVATTSIGGNAPGGGGSNTAFAGPVIFSSINPNVLYELQMGVTSSGLPSNQLNELRLYNTVSPTGWTLTRTKLFNFNTDSSNCLPSNFFPNWGGYFNVSSDDQTFSFSFSDSGQNGKRDANNMYGATMLAVYSMGKGCRVLDTYGNNGESGPSQIYGLNASRPATGPMTIWGDWGATGTVQNGSGAPLPDVMYMHDGQPAPNSAYVLFGGTPAHECTQQTCSCFGITSGGGCEQYVWNVPTTNVVPDYTTGHEAQGNLYQYRGKKYWTISYANPEVHTSPLLTENIPVDQHGTYNNADQNDDQPVFFASTNVCDLAPGNTVKAGCDSEYTGPLYDEIVGVENQGAHPGTAQNCNYGNGPEACIYRFAHTFNTGTNYMFPVQNAIGNISPNGRFMLFDSDWNLTLGCTNGSQSPCVDNITASTGTTCLAVANLKTNPCQRGDIFVVKLY